MSEEAHHMPTEKRVVPHKPFAPHKSLETESSRIGSFYGRRKDSRVGFVVSFLPIYGRFPLNFAYYQQ
ncbi:hypothetical protein SAMN04487936_101404 [Halobacillus dabanensis]|uniref:Uncharacterized protein n=1 Tax=Halobacillus dabanensis TaxID=240302 RepID=A0A1I3PPM8_HALDA|nr:hypothetical protein SAMN04487936_101404 [Halobacillus dabanensis]